MKDFTWMEECQKAFNNLKQYLSSPPLLMKPSTDDELLMYVATNPQAVSLVLVQEKDKVH